LGKLLTKLVSLIDVFPQAFTEDDGAEFCFRGLEEAVVTDRIGAAYTPVIINLAILFIKLCS
jgi:hypothetical protein